MAQCRESQRTRGTRLVVAAARVDEVERTAARGGWAKPECRGSEAEPAR